jgi:hypothetical protein
MFGTTTSVDALLASKANDGTIDEVTTADGKTSPETSSAHFVDLGDGIVDVANVGTFGSRTDKGFVRTGALFVKPGRGDGTFAELRVWRLPLANLAVKTTSPRRSPCSPLAKQAAPASCSSSRASTRMLMSWGRSNATR